MDNKPHIQLHDDEKMILECQPSKSLTGYLVLRKMARSIFILFLFIIFFLMNSVDVKSYDLFSSANIPLVIVLGLLIISILVYSIRARANVCKHWYFITDKRCILYSGAWGMNKKIIPYNRIVDIDLNQNMLRQFFGIAAVALDRSGMGYSSSSSRIRANVDFIDGLSLDKAEKLQHLISEYMAKSNAN